MIKEGFVVVDIGYDEIPGFLDELQAEYTQLAQKVGMLN
jgi:hypothetical protein